VGNDSECWSTAFPECSLGSGWPDSDVPAVRADPKFANEDLNRQPRISIEERPILQSKPGVVRAVRRSPATGISSFDRPDWKLMGILRAKVSLKPMASISKSITDPRKLAARMRTAGPGRHPVPAKVPASHVQVGHRGF